ncbi:subtilase-type protease inhibitor [Streptomyces flavofungini]|uniref:Subtilase-type protease inhibitor n=1 Tax=Streptomyces flavofungini TaxID=68200 RepID=A0ABS0XAT0_9ACTN|nr:subtilase-type protease inhibitor [Streptomyces flavofungini]MBJ3810297.1 subtilase-type protease inhibitor [Streptomyces flavofungini]GHC50760.1 protease [Streptomyces flavofungini]
MRPLTVTSAALLALAAAVAPAAAAPGTGTPPREPGLFLTVSGDDNTWIRGVLLTCEPTPSGHHPHAARACAELDAVGGDFAALPVAPEPCTMEYAPVTVSASGEFRGRPVDWHRTFSNACHLGAGTGYVFRF